MSELRDVINALTADGDDVDDLVAGLTPDEWSKATPAPLWTIAHQIAHLAATFRLAGLAAADPAAFQRVAAGLSDDFDANVRGAMAGFLAMPPDQLLAAWRHERATAIRALAVVPADQAVPWLVRPLPPGVLAAAGMMELFGHGQDIADALGVERTATDRLRFLVGFAVHTWDFGYLARNLTPPAEPFRFEITAPSGALWCFGEPTAANRITGPARDFCLLVTRRRHHLDLSLHAEGEEAADWLELAQAYRGPAGEGRFPGQFAAVR